MNRHGARPEAASARLSDNGKLASADIFHRARHRADIARAARTNQDHTNVRQHKTPIRASDQTKRQAGKVSKFFQYLETIAYCLVSGKCAEAIFLYDRAILRVKLSPVAELSVHDRAGVFDMFSAKDMPKLVNQSEHIKLGFAVRALVAKKFRDRHDDIPGQTLTAITDTIDAGPPGCQNPVDAFSRKTHDQVIGIARRAPEFFLKAGKQLWRGGNAFFFGPGGNGVDDQANIELALVIVRSGLDQSASFVAPVWIACPKRNIAEYLDAHGPLRRISRIENGTRGGKERAKD